MSRPPVPLALLVLAVLAFLAVRAGGFTLLFHTGHYVPRSERRASPVCTTDRGSRTSVPAVDRPGDDRSSTARRSPSGPLAAVERSLSRHSFDEAERAARVLLAGPGLDRTAAGWARYELGEALFAQGRLTEALTEYETLVRESPRHRAAANAQGAIAFIRSWPAHRQMLAERRREP